MEPLALITGTGRSGSGYIAQVLNEAGVKCGHEDYWNPWNSLTSGLLVDSSWCALAVGLDGYQGRVFHQIRHPLDSVSSFARHEPQDGPYRTLRLRLMPREPADPVEFGMLAWSCYVEAAQHRAERAWRLEDVDVDLVVFLGAAVGVEVSSEQAERALAAVPKDYNCHGPGPRLTWDDLPAGGLRDQLLGWCRYWGWE